MNASYQRSLLLKSKQLININNVKPGFHMTTFGGACAPSQILVSDGNTFFECLCHGCTWPLGLLFAVVVVKWCRISLYLIG